jgi:hypothetical protein
MTLLPRSISAQSLELRCWSPEDAVGMLAAIEESLPELEQEPSSGEILGAVGLHRTDDPEKFEVGYWMRTSRTRKGVAT